MPVDQLINLLASVTLIEMMLAIGLATPLADTLTTFKNPGLLARAFVANYLLFPGAAVALLLLFHANPMVAAGFLIAAVCPGAPYGPPFTAMAKGNVILAVGLMVVLSASSAIVAPLLLQLLLPILGGTAVPSLNVSRLVATLLGTQLLPLAVGLGFREFRPTLSEKLRKPARIVSLWLNLLTLAIIIGAQFAMLKEIRLKGCFGMLCLIVAGLAAGRLMGGTVTAMVKTMVLTTSVRNVGVSLVIAACSFPGTPAITATTAYAIFQTIAIALVALAWGRITPAVNLVKSTTA